VIDVQYPETHDLERPEFDSLKVLYDQVQTLIFALKSSNADPRLQAIAAKYAEALDVTAFSSVRLELFANNIRGLLQSAKEELSGPAVVSATALMLSHEQAMRQFPEWRAFIEQGQIASLSSDTIEKQNSEIIKVLTSQNAGFSLSISARTRTAALEIEQITSAERQDPRERDAVLRSVMNFIKANVSYVLKHAKNGYIEGSSTVQKLYLSLFSKLLPHFKLYCSYVPDLLWLVPILDYIQDLSPKPEGKKRKK
jgi:hypothetical protein